MRKNKSPAPATIATGMSQSEVFRPMDAAACGGGGVVASELGAAVDCAGGDLIPPSVGAAVACAGDDLIPLPAAAPVTVGDGLIPPPGEGTAALAAISCALSSAACRAVRSSAALALASRAAFSAACLATRSAANEEA